MTIINTTPDRPIQLGYEGEDRVTVLRFRYSADWLENGEGIFNIRVRRHGEHTAYNAQLVTDDRENTTLFMTVTDVELSVKGFGEMQVVYTGSDFVKKSPIYSYNVSRAVDEVADPPAQDVYTQIIESLSDLQTDVQGLADAVDGIGNLADLTTTAKNDLVSAINEVNEHGGGGGGSVTVDSELSTTSTNPVQNKVVTSAIRGKADIQTVSALADEVNGLDGDVQSLQTTKADKSYVDTQLAGKASTQTVSDLSDDVSDLQTGLAGKVGDVQIDGTSIVTDGVAELPIANTSNKFGIVKYQVDYGITTIKNTLAINAASFDRIRAGISDKTPIVPSNQHQSVFFALAKVAGHEEKNSTLPVGTYSEEAKSAISDMLNGAVLVEGTTPTITALSGVRYVCGEVATLDFTPCATGICDVVFTSGSTPTVVTLPNTVKFPDGSFTAEANKTYEINIMDGAYGAVMAWT